MRYVILGPAQALRDDSTPVVLSGGRLRALLTALARRPGRAVAPDVLIEEVWDGEPPADATGALQALVGRLRRALGHERVGSVDGGYRLEAAREDVDLFRFERLAEEGRYALAAGDPGKAAALLADALALWRGPALSDLPGRGSAAVRVEALRLDVQRQRLAAELELGRAAQILPELAALAAGHPLDEPLHALHLRALRATGRTAEALTAFEALRRALADELGTDPSAELRALHAELLRPEPLRTPAVPVAPARTAPAEPAREPAATAIGVPAAKNGDRAAADRSRPSGGRPPGTAGTRRTRPPGNGRARLTSFVGREAELDAVRRDLGRSRLVTITGPGGTGKTRLSQEAGDLVAERWPDGVWYAELAPVRDPRTLPEAVVSQLGLRETMLHTAGSAEATLAAEGAAKQRDPVQQLAEHCAGRELLLVLDNCEHVIDAAAALTEQLLADCPGLTVLATSREPLGVPGELVRPLDPLPDPTALRLLADRGAAARPGFTVEEDPAACAELCRRLDGLPLAIELAAARLRGLSPRQLADRLDDRFRLLTGGSRTLLPRQQTLRAVVDWSWDLLEPAERLLLRRLAVFRGGCTLEALEAVCADPPGTAGDVGAAIETVDAAALVASLVDKSLVLADRSPDGSRYRMLETIFEYASDRLDESGERAVVERRHIEFYREFARTADPRLRQAGQLDWFERLEREHENLRAAVGRAVAAGDEQEALVLVLACDWFWEVRHYTAERRHWVAAVCALGPDPFAAEPDLRPVERGPLDDPPPLEGARLIEARRHLRVIELSSHEGDAEWLTDPALRAVGAALIDTYPPHLPQSARRPGISRTFGAFFSGSFDRVRELIDETVDCCRRFGRTWELAYTLQLRAKMNNDLTESVADAQRDISEARRLFEQLGDEWGTAETLSAEAEAAGNSGDWEYAARCCRQAIALARKLGADQQTPVLEVRLGESLASLGELDEGERVIRAGIEEAGGYGRAADGAEFFGRVTLAMLLGRTGRTTEALEVVEQGIAQMRARDTVVVPEFVVGVLEAARGFLLGRLGRPAEGLELVRNGVRELNSHPLSHLITPRLAVVMATGAAELLLRLAENETENEAESEAVAETVAENEGGSAPGGVADRRTARLTRAAVLLAAHDRLRPNVPGPLEARDTERVRRRLLELLGEEAFAAAQAKGGGLSAEEAAALMRDVD